MNPARIRPDLVTEMISDELLIYDPLDSSCHCLNPQATVVWQGLRDGLEIAEIEALLAQRFPDVAPPTDVVAAALIEFRERNLLAAPIEQPPLKSSRRRVLKAIGLGLIATIVTPLPAAAVSRRVTITSATYFANRQTFRGNASFGAVKCTLGTDPGGASGTLDCTASLASYVTTTGNGEMTGFIPSNTSCGSDPISGTQKMFKVIYKCDGGANQTLFLCETQTIAVYC